MKTLLKILLLILFFSCSSDQLTLEQYANRFVWFNKQEVIYPNNDFSLFIPEDWEWKVETYRDDRIILGIDATSKPDKDGFIDLISIQKAKSFGEKKALKPEFEYLLNLTKQQYKVIESGETDIFKQNAYFIHIKSDSGTYGEAEVISFILESKTNGEFYHLNCSASQTSELKDNMTTMIKSFQTFEIR